MKVSNLDTIEFIFNFIYLNCILFYSVAWLFLGYGIMQVVQKKFVIKMALTQ